jgi:hypothetical protein
LVESYPTRDVKVRERIINLAPVHRYTKQEIRKIIREPSRFFKLEETVREGSVLRQPRNSGALTPSFTSGMSLDGAGYSGHISGAATVTSIQWPIARCLWPIGSWTPWPSSICSSGWMGWTPPAIRREDVDCDHLLRSMDFLIEHKKLPEAQARLGPYGSFRHLFGSGLL